MELLQWVEMALEFFLDEFWVSEFFQVEFPPIFFLNSWTLGFFLSNFWLQNFFRRMVLDFFKWNFPQVYWNFRPLRFFSGSIFCSNIFSREYVLAQG